MSKMMLTKSIAAIFGVAVALVAPSARAEREWVDIKLGVDELEILGTDFGNIVLLTAETYLNELDFDTGIVEIDASGLCFRVRFRTSDVIFELRPLSDGDVSFVVEEDPSDPTRTALITLSLKNIRFDISFPSWADARTLQCTIPIFCFPLVCATDECEFIPTGSIEFDEIALDFNLFVEDDGLTLGFELEEVNIPNTDITIQLNIEEGDGDLCDVFDVLDNIEFIADAILDLITDNLDIVDDVVDAIVDAFPPVSITLPDPLIELPVFPGRSFALTLFVTTLQGNPAFLRTRFTTNFKGALSEPSWRNGYSYSPELTDSPLPEVGSDSQLNINIGSTGLNAGFATAWYLLWSTIATDEASQNSPLCQAGENDPCIFPPIIEIFDIDNNLAIYKTLNSFFFGIFESIKLSFVIPPAELKFSKKNTLQGMATAEVLLEGSNSKKTDEFLMKLTVGVIFTSTIPQLNVEDRKFCCWTIKVMVGKPKVETFNPIYAVNAISLQSIGVVVQKIVQSIITPLIKEANMEIEEFLDEFTFEWPVIPFIPGGGSGTEISAAEGTNVITIVAPKDEDEQSVLQITGGVVLTVVDID